MTGQHLSEIDNVLDEAQYAKKDDYHVYEKFKSRIWDAIAKEYETAIKKLTEILDL
jgi:hypothetical protein